uniref:PLAT domain-containing protein n=1 Tax=Peromyscus maniculatus bairdii TaxID=230844 RepID=A0A8C8UBZ3_PERMB
QSPLLSRYHGSRRHHVVWRGQPEWSPALRWGQSFSSKHLGSVWKIRVWHDNKGLSPAWFLQHIIVRDLQSARSTFFLVNDWLSVETEANGGLVEKEVLAANEAALWQFQRLLVAELQRGFFDKHIWLSIWDRPPRSRFTRVQRVTCCVLLLCLFLAANAVWYGVVGDSTYSTGPVSSLIPPSVDTVAIGLVSSVVVYPVYLAVLFLFRMSRSKVAIPAVLLPMWTLPLLLDCSEPPLSHLWRGLMGTRGPAHHPFREGVGAGQH